jgi:hypothetical protein
VFGLPAASANTVLFNQALTGAPAPIDPTTSMCNLFVRSEMPSPTTLVFSRGGDNPNSTACTNPALASVAWERVDFGNRARVQAFTQVFNSLGSTDVTIASVDTTRTLVFSGGQMAAGQATGETSADTANDDTIGTAVARFELINDTTVRVTKGHQGSGTFTFYVVELEP